MSYVFRQGDLPKLDLQVDRGTDFAAWKSQWHAYLSLSGLEGEDQGKQVKALTLCFSRETVTIVNNLGLSADQRRDAREIVRAIQLYVDGQLNESVERRAFRRRTQQSGESFDDFLVSLRELAKTCNFCSDACMQKSWRDQIIEGLMDGDIVETLLREQELTLETTISKCRAQEAAKSQRAEIAGTSPHVQATRHSRRSPATLPSTRPQADKVCPGCGSAPHPGGRQHCPAYTLTCHFCKKPGHMMRVCKLRKGHQQPLRAAMITYTVTSDDYMPEINTSVGSHTSVQPAPRIRVHLSALNGQATMQVLPDSGADVSLAGPALPRSLNDHPDNLVLSTMVSRAVNGSLMEPVGQLPVTFSPDSKTYHDNVYIYPGVTGVLLSWRVARGLGILPSDYPRPQHPPPAATVQSTSALDHSHTIEPPLVVPTLGVVAATDLTSEFPSVFDGTVKVMEGEEFRIVLSDDAQPFCVHTPRTVPFAYTVTNSRPS